KVVDIYQGTDYYKINFNDLARLFYYDQNTSSDKIYKRPDNENYISESSIIRKAIFEILTGNSFEEYYQSIANYRKLQQEQSTIKALLQNFESLNIGSDYVFEGKNSYNLELDLKALEAQLNRLEDYRESINSNTESSKSKSEVISQKRADYNRYELKSIDLKRDKYELVFNFRKVNRLKSDLILEVTQMKKIIVTNEALNLFSPDTCPYCLQKSDRDKDTCICGNKVNDVQYQKFFYTKEEYLNILNSKQKNIITVDNALKSYEKEILTISSQIALYEKRMLDIKSEINHMVKGKKIVKNLELKDVNDKIFYLQKTISAIKQQIRIESKKEELEREKDLMAHKVESAKRDMDILKLEASKNMDSLIVDFNKKYYSLMEKALFDCSSAKISTEDYMPIINSGSYKEASSNVSKRLMYFFTLLHLSLTKSIKFPKFLLIDTPENIGIDYNDLINALSLINEIGDENHNINEAQIILTTGLNKYPKALSKNVFQTITKTDKLLTKRIYDIGN
ncbi:MAG: hypothetical protein ACM31G_00320, partial [Flavobacteriales bacterium]